MSEPLPKRLLKPKQVAKLLGVSLDTLKDWRCAKASRGKRRVGPRFVKVEGVVRYRVVDLETFLARRTVRMEAQ